MNSSLQVNVVAALATLVAGSAAAQVGGGRAGVTPTNRWMAQVECTLCTVHLTPTLTWVEFGAEPVVRGNSADGGVLLDGDVIVAVNGKLITTTAGAMALAQASQGTAQVTIRRGGKQFDVIVPQNIRWSIDPTGHLVFASARDSAIVVTKWQRDAEIAKAYLDGAASANRAMGEPGVLVAQANLREAENNIRLARVAPGSDRSSVLPYGATAKENLLLGNGSGSGFQVGKVGFSDIVRTDTLADGTRRTISNDGRDTTYHVSASGKGAVALLKRPVLQDSSATHAVLMDRETTRGWLGIALSCERCSLDGLDHTSSNKQRLWTTFPHVIAVDPVAALVSGFKVRDIIRSIDGLAITSPEGGARFSTLRAGERVKFVVERFVAGSMGDPNGGEYRLVTLNLVVPKRP